MREGPKDVTSVEHNGIRYEAPHYGIDLVESPPEPPATVESRMGQVLREKMLQGDDLTQNNPDDPAWIRSTLSAAGFATEDVETAVRRRQVESVLGRVARAQMQSTMMKALMSGEGFGDGGPMAALGTVDRDQLAAELSREGLNAEQVQMALESWDRQMATIQSSGLFLHPPNGGHLLARDAASGKLLWKVRLYETDQEMGCGGEIFVTELEIEGDHLLVVDETRRVFRVHLETHTVEQLARRPWPEVPDSDYPVYAAALRFVSERAGRSGWVVQSTVQAFPDHGAVLELCDGSKRRLTPALDAAQDTRRLTDRLQPGLFKKFTDEPGLDDSTVVFTRVAHDPARGEAVVCLYGAGHQMLYLMLGADGQTVTEVEYKWDYGGAYGLPDEALSSEDVLAGVLPNLLGRLENAFEMQEAGGDRLPRELLEMMKKRFEEMTGEE